jgi:hypothetical protein
MTGGLDLATKCEIASLVYEAQIGLTAVVAGIRTIAQMVGGDLPPTHLAERLGVLGKMLNQSEDALDALDARLEDLLQRRSGGLAEAQDLPMVPRGEMEVWKQQAQIFDEALSFYANPSNWRKPRGRPSAAEQDQGRQAINAFAAVEADDDDDEGAAG